MPQQIHRIRRLVRSFVILGLLFGSLSSACLPDPRFPVVKIGLIAPFEGRYRYIGYDAIYAARLAVREINAEGGVAGHKLALVAYDDRNDPELARSLARNLATDPDVLAVIGHYRQKTTAAAQDVYVEHDLPLLAVGAWPTSTPAFQAQLMPAVARLADTMVAQMAVSAGSSCGIVWGQDSLTQPLVNALDGRVCSQIEAPDFVFSGAPAHAVGSYLSARRSDGWEGQVIGGPSLGAPDFVDVAGVEVVEGTSFLTPYPFPDDISGTGAWIQAYESMGPHVPEPGPYALPTYEAVYLLAEAFAERVEVQSQITRRGVEQALGSVTRTGALGRIRLDSQGVWRNAPLYVYVWRDGEPQLERVRPPLTVITVPKF